MCLVPLTERRSVDGDDGVLDEGLGSDQLVVAGVVDGVDDTSLASDRLRSPREVTGVQSVRGIVRLAVVKGESQSPDRWSNISTKLPAKKIDRVKRHASISRACMS